MDNDYTIDMYERYMLTGEGREYFEDYIEEDIDEEDDADEYIEETIEAKEAEEIAEYRDFDEQLDDIIYHLRQQIKQNKRPNRNKKST